ncbi:hypothetical protein DIPPA_01260 [Diplonema papillatum]|nr:hypothetical protein DIPPA_01260 [Diplonema papillatum]
MGKKDDKEKDGFADVESFKSKHTCNVLLTTPFFLITGGAKIHVYDKKSREHMTEIKTGHDVTAMCFSRKTSILYAGLNDGTIKSFNVSAESGRMPEVATALPKIHMCAVTALEACGESLYSGSSDGSIVQWEGTMPKYEKLRTGKTSKHIMKFFPEKSQVLVATPEEIYLTKEIENYTAESSWHLATTTPAQCRAATGYITTNGESIRVFLGFDDGNISVYDVHEGEQNLILHPTITLDKVHVKGIHSMRTFGQYLVTTAADRIVCIWSGKEESRQCSLIRKIQHNKGSVAAMFVEGTPAMIDADAGALWCFDDANKRMYRMVLENHIPSLSQRRLTRQLTFEVNEASEANTSNPVIPAEEFSDHGNTRPEISVSPNQTPEDRTVSPKLPSPSPMTPLKFKDFYSDLGTVQKLLDDASEWIASQGDSLTVMSVCTIPVIGSKFVSDALFKHSLVQNMYEATLRTKPEHTVPVIQVVRVIYSQLYL